MNTSDATAQPRIPRTLNARTTRLRDRLDASYGVAYTELILRAASLTTATSPAPGNPDKIDQLTEQAAQILTEREVGQAHLMATTHVTSVVSTMRRR
ncbi:hypothetical protein RCO28_20770 [Streptomyces sp. LHD-70]|uniref:hypothetical protein n=1 Tax=Streptomyces sp. LHD-70 TaxID=3072140 RepID=UPI00280D6830|nr:hypothetical protein [Streptomyces sp. LHD-70]MDQ8704906.1 hypothetical protein [Streptomyces sp. LHD-70]